MLKYTQLKDHKRQNLIDVIPLKKPFTVLIEPSNFCNFSCVSCFQSLKSQNYLTKNRGFMSMELYKEIIRQLQQWEGGKLKVLKLSLYGEPFTNPHFGEMLQIAREADIAERIETTTNMSLLTAELCEKLIDYEIDYIRVSIYGSNQKRYQQVTGKADVSIDNIKDNLRMIQQRKNTLHKEKPFVSAKMLDTYSPENEEFMQLFQDIADEVYIDKPHNWVAAEEKNFIGSLYGEQQQQALKEDLQKTCQKRIACPMAFTTLAIRSNGAVSPCCVDWSGGTNLGNIADTPIREIWEGDVMYEFRKMQLENRRKENPSCRNCELADNNYYTRDNIDGFPVEKLRG